MAGSRKTYRAGLWAEMLAALYLQVRGYRILYRRAKTPVGEIDLVARKRRAIIFVEVKRRADPKAALEALTPAMQERLNRAGQYLWAGHPGWHDHDARFDLIAISMPFFIRHIDNAWQLRA